MVKIQEILGRFDQNYGTQAICYLNYQEPWQLLMAVILSAQCTDARVNIVTPDLFFAYPSLEALSKANLQEVERLIHSTGFYHNKSKNIIACAAMIVEQYHSKLPSQMDELLKLPGVGRKTANVILGNIYGQPSIVVDTHVKRISRRLGFTNQTDPEKIEYELMEQLPRDHWTLYNMQVITFGREICTAQSPKCRSCFLWDLCDAKEKIK
jgi:endonuclease III